MCETKCQEDAKLVRYKAIRAHELELNRATGAFEHAALRPVVILNGGALVAFLSLLGAVWEPDNKPAIHDVSVAIGVNRTGFAGGSNS